MIVFGLRRTPSQHSQELRKPPFRDKVHIITVDWNQFPVLTGCLANRTAAAKSSTIIINSINRFLHQLF